MLKIGRRFHRWIVTRCWFDFLRSTFCFYQLKQWFQINGFWITNFPQLIFYVEFHIVIGFQKFLLYHLSYGQDRYIWFIILHHTIIIKPELFQWAQTSSICIGLSSFTFFEIRQAHESPYIFLTVQPHFELSEPTFSANLFSWKIKFGLVQDMLTTN